MRLPYGRGRESCEREGGGGATTTAAGTHHIFHSATKNENGASTTTERKLCKCKLDEHKNENETKKCDVQKGGGCAEKKRLKRKRQRWLEGFKINESTRAVYG